MVTVMSTRIFCLLLCNLFGIEIEFYQGKQESLLQTLALTSVSLNLLCFGDWL